MAQEGSRPTFKTSIMGNAYSQALSANQDPADIFGEIKDSHSDLFDASHPLAFDNAQNTAQRTKDKSNQLQDAYQAITSDGFMQNLSKSFQGFNQKMKNSTANIAPYGFTGNQRNVFNAQQDRQTQTLPFGIKGSGESIPHSTLPFGVSNSGVSESTGGISPGMNTKDYLAARDINKIKETPKPEPMLIPKQYQGLMAPIKTL
jgi:hypothetical protein